MNYSLSTYSLIASTNSRRSLRWLCYREEFFVADFMVEVHEAVAVADHLNESGLHMSWDNSESRQVAGDTLLLGEFGMTTLGENVAPHIEDGF